MWPWLRRKAASEERRQCVKHTVNSSSNGDAALALWPPQRRPTVGTIEREPRWRDRSALQHINPTGSNLHGDHGDVFACAFCLMFVFSTFGPRVARESGRVIEARSTLCIATPHIFTVKARSLIRSRVRAHAWSSDRRRRRLLSPSHAVHACTRWAC